MGNKPDKESIRKRFSRRLESYAALATVQQEIARSLALSLKDNMPERIESILEVGCGTGFLTREILSHFKINKLYLNDLVPEATLTLKSHTASKGIDTYTIDGDAESVSFPEKIDAVVSASTLQWFHDLPQFIAKASASLNNNGVLAFNTFGYENLFQVRELTGEGLDYHTIEELREMLSLHFNNVELREEIREQYFRSPMEVLRHLQLTGVASSTGFKWSKSALSRFENQYRVRFAREKGVFLTWHVVYAICR